jgi:hypothetical protein
MTPPVPGAAAAGTTNAAVRPTRAPPSSPVATERASSGDHDAAKRPITTAKQVITIAKRVITMPRNS